MKKHCTLILSLLLCLAGAAQNVYTPGPPDSLFPVTNREYEYGNTVTESKTGDAEISGLLRANGKIFWAGEFTHIAQNHGSTAVVDTAARTVLTPGRWAVKGDVYVALSDGNGGYYIGGAFTRVGDSLRRNIAHIGADGQALPWTLGADTTVRALLLRNDTLFIGGNFRYLNNLWRANVGLYRVSSRTLLPNSGYDSGTPGVINSLLLVNDTLILGGKYDVLFGSSVLVKKWSFRTGTTLNWTMISGFDFTEVRSMGISADTSVLWISGYYNGNYIRGFNYRFGYREYEIKTSFNTVTEPGWGSFSGFAQEGNKVYVAGRFNFAVRNGSYSTRRGFFAFDARSGAIESDQVNFDYYPASLHRAGDKLLFSGHFRTVAGAVRNNFAALRLPGLALDSFQLAPTDAITAIAFSGDRAFVAGRFRGLYSVRRNGIAIIDSATRQLLPFNPVNLNGAVYIRRMFVKGDSLFVFGQQSGYGYWTNSASGPTTVLKVFRISTGQQLAEPFAFTTRPDDVLLDGNYLYASLGGALRRLSLPAMSGIDAGWGHAFATSVGEYTPRWLLVNGSEIVSVGEGSAGTVGGTKGIVCTFSKATGTLAKKYVYASAANNSLVSFRRAVISGNRIWVNGGFDFLNDSLRRNFALLRLADGAVLPWKPAFQSTDSANGNLVLVGFSRVTDMQLYDGRLWISDRPQLVKGGRSFPGFAAIDTSNGNMLLPGPVRINYQHRDEDYDPSLDYGHVKVHAFVINDRELMLSGTFDSLNQVSRLNFGSWTLSGGTELPVTGCSGASTRIASNFTGSVYRWQVDAGNGFTDIGNDPTYAGTDGPVLELTNIPASYLNYRYRAVVDGSFSQVYTLGQLVAGPPVPQITPSGALTVCSGTSLWLQSSAPAGNQWLRSGSPVAGAVGTAYRVPFGAPYSVLVTEGPCFNRSAEVIVAFTPRRTPAIALTSSGCQSDGITYSASVQNAGATPTVQWFVNGTQVATGSSYLLATPVNGTQVYARVLSSDSCSTQAAVNSVVNTVSCVTTAVTNLGAGQYFEVTPNPTRGPLRVRFRLGAPQAVRFTLLDGAGRPVWRSGTSRVGTETKTLQPGSLAAGTYYLQLQLGAQLYVHQVVIQ